MRRRPKSSSARIATPATAVFDASALVRALPRVGDEAAAAAWVEEAVAGRVRATVPDLVYGEVANALLSYVRAGRMMPADAHSALKLILELPLRTVSLKTLAADALALAEEIGLSVYDACYAVLSEATSATLVTADRRLAATVERVALLPDDGPPTRRLRR
jgi:predicted nucleic acid-binding protein